MRVHPGRESQDLIGCDGREVDVRDAAGRNSVPVDHQFVRLLTNRQVEGGGPDLEVRHCLRGASGRPGDIALGKLIPIGGIRADRNRGRIKRNFGDDALMEVAHDGLADRHRRVTRIVERTVNGAGGFQRQDIVRGHRAGLEGLVDVEPTAEESVDFVASGVRDDVLNIAEQVAHAVCSRVGLLVHGEGVCVDAGEREARNGDIFLGDNAGQRNGLSLWIIGGRAAVLFAGRVVVDAGSLLRGEETEENAHGGCADQADVADARERKVKHRDHVFVQGREVERRAFLVRGEDRGVVEALPARTAAAFGQLIRYLLDEIVGGGGVAQRLAEFRLAPAHGEDAQIHAEPWRVAVEHVRVGLLDQLDLARGGDAGDGDLECQKFGAAGEVERRIAWVGAEIEVVQEREALWLRSI